MTPRSREPQVPDSCLLNTSPAARDQRTPLNSRRLSVMEVMCLCLAQEECKVFNRLSWHLHVHSLKTGEKKRDKALGMILMQPAWVSAQWLLLWVQALATQVHVSLCALSHSPAGSHREASAPSHTLTAEACQPFIFIACLFYILTTKKRKMDT